VRRAIELPARRAGLRVEPALSKAMVADVAGEPGGLPLLSTALLECWERRQGHTLTLAGYRERGGVHGAVARLAERAYQALGPEEQAAARRLLLRLAGPGEGQAVTRRRVPLVELEPERDPSTARALEVLTARRLLTKGEGTVEVAHEALLREWPRLRGWLEEDTQGRALHRHLTQAAGEWAAAERDPGELYRGARLTAALEWARDHRTDLNDLERGFLDASRAAAEREVADARRRADREARTSRRLRGLLAGLAVVLVLALVAGGFALAQRGRAERQTLVADSRRLGAQSLIQGDLDRSLLLAVEAVRLDDSVEARSALFTSLLRSPQAIWTTRGDGNGFEDLALSPDGRTLATVDTHGLLDLWDAQTGRRLAGPLQGSNDTYQIFAGVTAFSPDSRQVATGGREGFGGMQLWDVASHKVINRPPLAPSEGDLTDAAFSPNGHLLVAATVTGALAFWNPQTGAPIGRALHPHHPHIIPNEQIRGVSLAFADHGATLFTSAQGDKTIAWDVAHRRPIREFPLGGALAVSPNGLLLAFGQRDGRILLADARTGQSRRALTGHTAEAWNLAFSPDSATLVSVSIDATGIVWDVATGQALQTLRGHNGWVTALVVSPDGDGATVYTSSYDDSLMAWDLTGTRGLARRLTRTAGEVGAVAFNPSDPDMLGLARSDGPARLWSVAKRAPIGTPFPVGTDPQQQTNAVAFRPDGKVLAAEDRTDGTVRLFDLATHTRIGVLDATTHPDDVTGVSFSRDGKLLATAGGDGSAIVWDLSKQPPLRHQQYSLPDVPDNWPDGVAFSPDGTMVVWGMDDGTIVLTRVADGTILHTLTVTGRNDASAPAVAFSPDGRTLAAGTWDGHERLWDPSTGTPRGPAWQARGGPIVTTSFSPDGRMLATSGPGSAELWDAASEKQLGTLSSGLAPTPAFAAFDPTGHTLVTAFQDGPVLLWAVDPTSWTTRACALAGRRLTQQEWQDFLPGRPYKPSCGPP
jgi:WD40 repeat protein